MVSSNIIRYLIKRLIIKKFIKMKKIIFSLILSACMFALQAQEFDFPLNENGVYVLTGEIPYSGDKVGAKEGLAMWFYNSKVTSQLKQEKGDTTVYEVGFNVSASYNPFAGSFSSNLISSWTFVFGEKSISYKFERFYIQQTYSGFGTNNKLLKLEQVIRELDAEKEKMKQIESDASLSKKQKKEQLEDHADIIEDRTELLSKSYTVLMRNLEKIKVIF